MGLGVFGWTGNFYSAFAFPVSGDIFGLGDFAATFFGFGTIFSASASSLAENRGDFPALRRLFPVSRSHFLACCSKSHV